MSPRSKQARIRELSFQKLLNQAVGELDLKPADALRICLIRLRQELKKKHISFFPNFYLGEEPWGCIDGTTSVEIPFFLANRQIRRIAERYYITYSDQELMLLLRHETGHAVNYAYKLWRQDEWKQLFGQFKKRYRDFYNHDPYSRDFVRHLHYIGHPHYAQKHPDEDFAETFAVWLNPESNWQKEYRSWNGALEKLRYVDKLFRKEKIAVHRPLTTRTDESGDYRSIVSTVAEYFEIEKKVDPRVKEYMKDLKEIFSGVGPRARKFMRADRFIQTYSGYLEEELSTWIAGVDIRDVRKYLREIQILCALNDLRVHPDNATEKLVELVIVSTYHMLRRVRIIR
jgi:hypothetical protein